MIIAEMCTVPSIENGRYEKDWAVNSYVSQGNSSAILCDDGSEYIGDDVDALCGEGGNWTSTPTCRSKDVDIL